MQDSLESKLMDHSENITRFVFNFGVDYSINNYLYLDYHFNEINFDGSLYKNNYGATFELEYQNDEKQVITLNLSVSHSPNQDVIFGLGETSFRNKNTNKIDTFRIDSRISNQYYNLSLGVISNLELGYNLIGRLYITPFELFYFTHDKVELLHDNKEYEIYDIQNDNIIKKDLLNKNNIYRIGFGVGLALAYNYKLSSNFIRALSFEAGLIFKNYGLSYSSAIDMFKFSSFIHF